MGVEILIDNVYAFVAIFGIVSILSYISGFAEGRRASDEKHRKRDNI